MRKIIHADYKEEHKRANTIAKPQQMCKPEEPLKYFLGPGNNTELIKRVMRTRSQWIEAEGSKDLFVNLRWHQTNKNFKYQNCIQNRIFRQCLNHLEYHQQLSNKEYLFRNVYEYCENHKLNIFEFVPITFILNLAESNFEHEQLFFRNFYNKNRPQKQEPQILYLKRRRMNPNNFFNQSQKTEGTYCKYEIKDCFSIENTPYLWILKPTFYNRGNGVHVFSSLTEMEDIMTRYMHGVSTGGSTVPKPASEVVRKSFRIRELKQLSLIRTNSFVVQKYMEKPLLIAGRKFDIRVWVLVTHQMKIYLFKEGYLRTSSYAFSLAGEKTSDPNIHLTNNAVQKHSDDYGRFQSGNQLSFDYLRDLLKSTSQCYEDFISKIKQIIKITMLAVRRKLNKQDRSYCFQIFGYDFMLDQEGNPWLIQVNTNPCLQESSPILQELLPRMIDDCFALTIDQIFDQKRKHSCFSVGREDSQENLWDFVVDLKKC